MLQVLGWIGTVVFFFGAWFLGRERHDTRRFGLLLVVVCNLLYAIQAVGTSNHSLLTLSVGAAALQTLAWRNWRKYDGK